MSVEPTIRRVLRPGDLGEIVAHHGRVYGPEFGVDTTFEGHVAAAVARAATRGFPSEREAIWIVEAGGGHAGSLALTDEGDDEAAVRWFVLDRAVRGHGLGRRLLGELLETARASGYARIWLETFSDLRAAAHLYRDHGFVLVSEDATPRWGRNRITYQRYELELNRDESEIYTRSRRLRTAAVAAKASAIQPLTTSRERAGERSGSPSSTGLPTS
jgi:ribosomal protein S18 acetylase RimI-like enzyme